MKASKPRSLLTRWSPELKSLRALSLRQPWAWLVVNGYKDIENRSWRTNHRGSLLIHASQSMADYSTGTAEWIENEHAVRIPNEMEFGTIVGVVDVIDCVKQHPSKWKFKGSWGWVLGNPRRLPSRKCKGFVGLFKPKF